MILLFAVPTVSILLGILLPNLSESFRKSNF